MIAHRFNVANFEVFDMSCLDDCLYEQKRWRHKVGPCSVESLAYYTLTYHAQLRMAQRGLLPQGVDYVLRHGVRFHACEAITYYLRDIDIPYRDLRSMKRLEGTAIFVHHHQPLIMTVWRNRQHGLRNLRYKLAQIWYRERPAVFQAERFYKQQVKG